MPKRSARGGPGALPTGGDDVRMYAIKLRRSIHAGRGRTRQKTEILKVAEVTERVGAVCRGAGAAPGGRGRHEDGATGPPSLYLRAKGVLKMREK